MLVNTYLSLVLRQAMSYILLWINFSFWPLNCCVVVGRRVWRFFEDSVRYDSASVLRELMRLRTNWSFLIDLKEVSKRHCIDTTGLLLSQSVVFTLTVVKTHPSLVMKFTQNCSTVFEGLLRIEPKWLQLTFSSQFTLYILVYQKRNKLFDIGSGVAWGLITCISSVFVLKSAAAMWKLTIGHLLNFWWQKFYSYITIPAQCCLWNINLTGYCPSPPVPWVH